MRRNKEFGPHRGHLAQGDRPLRGITLNLLGIARIGKIPNEEISSTDRSRGRDPSPKMIVSLTPCMTKLDLNAPHIEPSLVSEDEIRIRRIARQELLSLAELNTLHHASKSAELPTIHDQVVPARQAITLKSCRNILVTRDLRTRMSPHPGLFNKKTRTANMIKMAVRKDERVEGILRPAPD